MAIVFLKVSDTNGRIRYNEVLRNAYTIEEMITILILMLIAVIIIATCAVIKRRYEKTEYFKQTHNSYLSVRMDTGSKIFAESIPFLRKQAVRNIQLRNCALDVEIN